MVRSKGIRVLLLVCFLLIIVTAYFYHQHEITIQRHIVNEKVVLQDVTVFVHEIVLKDMDERISFGNWRFKVCPKLPVSLQRPFSHLFYFYSDPYQQLEYEGLGIIEMRGHIIVDESIGEKERDNLWNNVNVDLVDEDGVHYSSGTSRKNEREENIYCYILHDDQFPQRISKVNITVNDERNGASRVIPIELKWQPEHYNFFNKMPSSYRYTDPKETIFNLRRLKMQGQNYDHLVYQGKYESLKTTIDDISRQSVRKAEYIGEYKGFEDVYRVIMEDCDGKSTNSSFYLTKIGKEYVIIEAVK